MHLGAVLGISAIPLLVGVGFLCYGGMAPMAWEEGHPPTRLTTDRVFVPIFFTSISVAILLVSWMNLYFANRSACQTFTGTITQLQWTEVKHGWKTEFNLYGDDGINHAIAIDGYIHRLKWGDRASATLRDYDDDVLGLDVLSGARSGLHLRLPTRDLSFAVFMTVFALASAGFAVGIATGRIQSKTVDRPAPSTQWLA